MSKLYTPPQWRNIQVMEGSLRYGVPTSFCTYKKNGTWHSVQNPGIDELSGTDWMFYTPTVITDALATEMQTAGVAGTYT